MKFFGSPILRFTQRWGRCKVSILVLSCGRTGTNMVTELLRGDSTLNALPHDDNSLFRRPRTLPENYLAKTDTWYIDNTQQIADVLESNPHLKIVWTVRNFKDVIMSKIYRGQPGNDNNHTLADDASLEGCEKDMMWMKECYMFIKEFYSDRLILSKMETLLENPEEAAKNLASQTNLVYNPEMLSFASRMRNSNKKSRYKGIDKSQLSLHERKEEVYNGFFKDYDFGNLDIVAEHLNKFFNYG